MKEPWILAHSFRKHDGMNAKNYESILEKTLDDHRLSRGERKALRKVFQEAELDPGDHSEIRSLAFNLARKHLRRPEDRRVLEWVQDVVSLLSHLDDSPREATEAKARFSPGEDCVQLISHTLAQARTTLDICVFTITDDRITQSILAAFQRKVRVRIVSDNEKAEDRGSDLHHLREIGVPVAVDTSPHHMHHKFMVADQNKVLTGSYNWTRSAASYNQENIVLCTDPRLVKPFHTEFERLWRIFGNE